MQSNPLTTAASHCTTFEAARLMGLAVRSVQMMVDRHELSAWRTPGGHRRIDRSSVQRWLAQRMLATQTSPPQRGLAPRIAAVAATNRPHTLLLIEDSLHYQSLVGMVVKQHLPSAELYVAGNSVMGLAMFGALQPDVLLLDLDQPDVDGRQLANTLLAHPVFGQTHILALSSTRRTGTAVAGKHLPNVTTLPKATLADSLAPALHHCLGLAVKAHPSV